MSNPTTTSADMAAQTPTTVPVNTIEVDDALDTESSYGEELSSYSTSLASSVRNYEWKHGRRYHSFDSGSYNFPNDEREQDRLDMFHHIITLSCNDNLFLAPIKPDGMRILDIGTGTGLWAIEMGDQHPNAELILGNDLSPIQPSWVPPNVKFVVDNVEKEWADKPYDYIHSRYMAASIQDWPKLVRKCFENLKPGGWVEFQDYNTIPYAEDGTLAPDNKMLEMLQLLDKACKKINRELSPGPLLKGAIKDAGFTNITEKIIKLPIGTWPKEKRKKEIGAFMALQYSEGIEAVTITPFTQILGWAKAEVEVFNIKAREDAKKRGSHALHDFHIVFAQKPE